MNLQIRKDIPLSVNTTFKIGGEASYFAKVGTINNLMEAVKFAASVDLPVVILGGGSNVLVSDKGLNAVVVQLVNKYTEILEETSEWVKIKVGAGRNWDKFVAEMVKRNLQGIECLSGIPGNVGAAPIQNIGAYGQELGNVFVELKAYDLEQDELITFNNRDCHFRYRDSIFKSRKIRGRYVIFDVVLKLYKNTKPCVLYKDVVNYFKSIKINNPSLIQVREAVISIRKDKFENPEDMGNSGSFFKNPAVSKEHFDRLRQKYPKIPGFSNEEGQVKLSAGWLIEKSGWKGKKHEDVAVSSKHALVIVNSKNKGTAKQVRELSEKIINDVRSMFEIDLEPEVNQIGFNHEEKTN